MKNDNVRKVFYIKDMEKKEKKIPVSRSKSAFKERERERKEKEREKAGRPGEEEKTQKDHSLCGDRRTRSALYPVKAFWWKWGSGRGNYDTGADRGSAADD